MGIDQARDQEPALRMHYACGLGGVSRERVGHRCNPIPLDQHIAHTPGVVPLRRDHRRPDDPHTCRVRRVSAAKGKQERERRRSPKWRGTQVIGSHQNPLLADGAGFDSAALFACTKYNPMRTTKIAPNMPQASPIGSSSNSNISRPALPIHE